MSKKLKISIGIFALAIVALSAWTWSIYKNRTSVPAAEPATQNQAESPSDDTALSPSSANELASDSDDEDVLDDTADEADTPTDNQTTTDVEADTFIDVTTKDCDNSCKSFSAAADLKYCQNVCGLSTPEKNVSKTADCADVEDSLDQDYCYKDLAISKNDMKICENIADTNLKKTCVNRLTEEIIDAQMQE